MKKTSLVLSAAVIALGVTMSAVSCSQSNSSKEGENATNETKTETVQTPVSNGNNGQIVYVQMDVIYQKYGKAIDLSAALEKKASNIQAEIDKRGKKLENEVKAFQEKINKGLITRSVAEMEGQKLQQKEAEFNQYAAQKQQEMQEEGMVTSNQINDAIFTFINKYNADKKYAMILTNQGGVPVITADPALDITEEIVAGLNAEYTPENK